MLNPKYHDWAALQMLHFAVLDFPFTTLGWTQVRWIRNCYENNFSFHTKKFFFKCATLHNSKINSFLDLKRSKRLLDYKSCEPLDTTVSSWNKTLVIHEYVCATVELVFWRIKNNKTEYYIHHSWRKTWYKILKHCNCKK